MIVESSLSFFNGIGEQKTMRTENEIPSESRQQVISKLKSIKENVILTSPFYGVPEAYINAYKQQENQNKLMVLMEMHEIRTQIWIRDKIDLQIYMELSLAVSLCEQLQEKDLNNEQSKELLRILKRELSSFLVGMDHSYRDTYYEGCFLNPVFALIQNQYEWNWLITNYDKPISDAEELQKCMYQFMTQMTKKPSHIILSAYDDCLKHQESYHEFKVIHLSEIVNYEQLKQEACMILHYLYPNLKRHKKIIEHTLNSLELQQLYTEKEYTPSIFMTGIRDFYEAYHCVDSVACFISSEEYLSEIQYYMDRCNQIHGQEKKKSKLYI